MAIESGYKHHDNPYHNSTHASDVVQTLHYFLTQLDIYEVNWLRSIIAVRITQAVSILAMLIINTCTFTLDVALI